MGLKWNTQLIYCKNTYISVHEGGRIGCPYLCVNCSFFLSEECHQGGAVHQLMMGRVFVVPKYIGHTYWLSLVNDKCFSHCDSSLFLMLDIKKMFTKTCATVIVTDFCAVSGF